jgi:hypothetical protein
LVDELSLNEGVAIVNNLEELFHGDGALEVTILGYEVD